MYSTFLVNTPVADHSCSAGNKRHKQAKITTLDKTKAQRLPKELNPINGPHSHAPMPIKATNKIAK